MARPRRTITLPTVGRGSYARKKFQRTRKRERTPVHLHLAMENDDGQRAFLPTLVFKRRWPSTTWVVPAVKTPLYWFDQLMVNKGLIVAIPPDIFIVDGRRFKVIAQDHKVIGIGYTRWLCYEEAAVPKGQKL